MSVVEGIRARLAEGEVVVIDGGMGTELQARGVRMDDVAWCATANLEAPEVVQEVHEDYIRAGADVIIANTFSAARRPLAAAGLGERVEEVNRGAVEAAVAARDRVADRPVAIAGSISSMVAYEDWGRPGGDPAELLEIYREQAAILAEVGVDLIALEMMQSPRLHRPAVEAAAETGLPVWLGLSAGHATAGKVPTWSHPEIAFDEAVAALTEPGVDVVHVMHTQVEDVDAALDVVFNGWTGPVGAYPCSGDFEPPHWTFGGVSPEALAAEAKRWVARGVQVVGGCCGTRPDHIRALKDELPSRAAARQDLA